MLNPIFQVDSRPLEELSSWRTKLKLTCITPKIIGHMIKESISSLISWWTNLWLCMLTLSSLLNKYLSIIFLIILWEFRLIGLQLAKLALFKIKDINVALAGHSQLLERWRAHIWSKIIISKSQPNNSLTVLTTMEIMDAVEDIWLLPSNMQYKRKFMKRKTIPILERMINALIQQEVNGV